MIKKFFKNKKWRWITLGAIVIAPLSIISCSPQSQIVNINSNDYVNQNSTIKKEKIVKTQSKITIEKSSEIDINKLNIDFDNLTSKQKKQLNIEIYKSTIYKIILAAISITIIIFSILIIVILANLLDLVIYEYQYRKEIKKRNMKESSNE